MRVTEPSLMTNRYFLENGDQTRQDYIERMEANGFVIVIPKDNELQIDIDTDEQFQLFLGQIECFIKTINDDIDFQVSPSRNGGAGRHITVELPFTVSTIERIALQAALGSDPRRELLSIDRYIRKDEYPTLFVEKGE
jgi:hypothetical protein